MKKSKIPSLLAAAATTLCLCGVLFFAFWEGRFPASTAATPATKGSEFSLEKAKQYLSLCAVSYYPKSLEAKFSEQGNSNFKYYSRNQNSVSGNGIAFGIAQTEEEGYTTVTAVFRGTHKGEWYSNFNIGNGTEHAGFSAAADYAIEEIESYLDSLGMDKASVNMVITGHSRGGAVANIVAKRLIDEGILRQVTAYTFASPNTTVSPDAKLQKYMHIYNILNPEDFIGYIPLERWGYTKYGIDLELPREGTPNFEELYAEMKKGFLLRTGYEHTGYPKHHKDVEEFLNAAANIAPTTEDYYSNEVTVSPHRVTLYDYMNKVAALLSGDEPLSSGMFLVASRNSPLFRKMTDFMMEGISIEDVAQTNDITKSAIGNGHTYETYAAWMDALDENYFLDIISKTE